MTPRFELRDRLRKAREVKQLSRDELADLLGVHRNTVANYETGRQVPTRATVLAWAMVTDCPAEWLEHGDRRGRSLAHHAA